jgi:CheY-like chemotaxis protein
VNSELRTPNLIMADLRDITARGVLVLEDNPDDAFLMNRAMSRIKPARKVRVVPDAKTAIAYLEGKDPFSSAEENPLPSLIFVDIKMPGMNGLEFLAWLRAQPLLKRIPAIILTSSKELFDIELAYDLGASSYFVKPTSFAEFSALLEQVLSFWSNAQLAPLKATPVSTL